MKRYEDRKRAVSIVIIAAIVISITTFSLLVIQQERVLRRYFVLEPQERLKAYKTSIAESLAKYFARENRLSDLDRVADYLSRYGRTSLFEMSFIFKDKNGSMMEVTKSGIAPVKANKVLSGENIYPAKVDDGKIDGYVMVVVKEAGEAELREGLKRYLAITSSLRLMFILIVLALAVILFYHNYSAKMKLAKDLAEVKASNDGLTSLHTHDYFIKMLEIEVERFAIYNTPIALLMLDIDHFKKFNDEYGHLAGDAVLQEVARIVKGNTRATDILARYGGEEFAVIMPYVAKPNERLTRKERLKVFVGEIKNVAERIRKSIEGNEVNFQSHLLNVRISVGAAFFYKRPKILTSQNLLRKADGALYKAKRLGRNKVCITYETAND